VERKGFGGITYEKIAGVTGDTSQKFNRTHKKQNQGRLDIDDKESIVRYCIWFAGPQFRSKLISILGEMHKPRKERDPAVKKSSSDNIVGTMVLETIWRCTKADLDLYERVFRQEDVELLIVTKAQRQRYLDHRNGRK
jgi:hypothetical protein